MISFSFSDLIMLVSVLFKGKSMYQNRNIIEQSKLKEFEIEYPKSTSINTSSNNNYKHSFYVFPAVSFKGDFGENPEVFLIYSQNDENIKFDTEQVLSSNNVIINKLEKKWFQKDRYRYELQNQISYYSNDDSQYDIRPFIILIIGSNSLGLACMTLINKSFYTRIPSDYGVGMVPFIGVEPYTPNARIDIWPNGFDLLKPLVEPETRKEFRLKDEDIKDILKLKEYIIEVMANPSNKKAYSSEYLG